MKLIINTLTTSFYPLIVKNEDNLSSNNRNYDNSVVFNTKKVDMANNEQQTILKFDKIFIQTVELFLHNKKHHFHSSWFLLVCLNELDISFYFIDSFEWISGKFVAHLNFNLWLTHHLILTEGFRIDIWIT